MPCKSGAALEAEHYNPAAMFYTPVRRKRWDIRPNSVPEPSRRVWVPGIIRMPCHQTIEDSGNLVERGRERPFHFIDQAAFRRKPARKLCDLAVMLEHSLLSRKFVRPLFEFGTLIIEALDILRKDRPSTQNGPGLHLKVGVCRVNP